MSDGERIAGNAKRITEAALVKIIRATAFQLLSAIVLDTPAISGRLRGNWDVTFNKESTLNDNELFDPAGSNTISKGKSKLEGSKLNDDIYLTNNVSYAGYVEDGTPKRKGRHMVLKAKTNFNSALERAGAKFRIT